MRSAGAAKNFDGEVEGGTSRDDVTSSLISISHIWWAGNGSFLSDLHLGEGVVPALDDWTLTDAKLEWLVSIERWIEFGSILKGTSVVDGSAVTIFALSSLTSLGSKNEGLIG